MMKKLLSLLLVLTLVLPCIPVQAFAASNQSEVLQYGSVDAAMDAYAQTALRPYKSKFTNMTAEGMLAFRETIDEVYGRDSHDDEANWLMESLVTLGFTVTENDNVWLVSKNQIELDLKYLLMLAQMDVMPFEDAVEQVQTYMPEYNLGLAALGVAADVFVNLLGGKLADMVKADALMYAPEMLSAGDKLRSGGFFSKTLAKALDYTVIKYGDIYSTATALGEAAKNLSGYATSDPALVNLVSSCNQAMSGAAFLEAMKSGGLTDPELTEACTMLSSAYGAFLTELEEISGLTNLHEYLQDEDYLSGRFDMLLSQELSEYVSGTDVMTAAAAGALTIIDVWQGGWGNIILKGGTNVIGEAAFGTTSTYTHFHAMLTLDRMYAAMSASAQSGSSWKDMVAYARSIQRLCNIALLGETHVYQLTTEDIGAGQKLWNMLKYEFTGEDQLAQNTAWYNQRVEYLHAVYNAAQEYIDNLYEHYDKLCLEAADMSPLWGYSNQLTGTFSGVVTEDKWFALPDGSDPDLDNPNPDADKPVDGIAVYLMSEGEIIAQTNTNVDGEYTLTYPLHAVKNRSTSLVIGDTEQDDFLVKENVSSPNHRSTAFRSSYRWNVDTETMADQSAAEQTFPLPYADDYFLNSSLEYNHNLALASLGLAAAAMTDPAADSTWTAGASAGRDGNICAAWSSLGYRVVASSGYGGNLNALDDSAAYTIAVKNFEDPDDRTNGIIPKQYRVIGVAIRGDVDAAELAHTLMTADGGSTYAGSTRSAATEILTALENAVNSGYSAEVPTMVWITGFSWGGAIAGQLSDLVRLRSSLNTKIRGLYTYTFGAPGASKGGYSASTSSSGIFNIVYQEDWIANGLLSSLRYKAPGQRLSFGKGQAGGRYLIASAFHDLTAGNSAYDPANYTADATVRTFLSSVDEAQSDTLYVKELQPLVTAILQMSFLRSDTGSDFRTLSLQDKHEQAVAITGMNRVVLNSTSTADDTLTTSSIEKMLDRVLTGTSRSFFLALPEDVQENLTTYLGDILRLAAKNSGEGSAFQLSEDVAEILLPLVLTLGDDFGSPTSLYSCLYAHHPEIYMAWMLGQSGSALFGMSDPDVFNTPILRVDKNLLGTVIDAESKKPLVNVPVHIVGGYGEDAVNRTIYTDEEGKWATFVKPADYTVTFELPGYEPKETRIYQSEHLINTLSNHTGVPVTKAQLEIDRVEMETELQALEHDSLVITTTTRYEEGDYYRTEIVHPYVYSTKNPALYSIVESAIGPTFDKAQAEANKKGVSSHTGCTWEDLRFHVEDWLYMATAYATDDVLSLTIHSGGFYCGFGHNFNTRTSYTFDIATGKRLTLDDLLDPANPNAKKDFQAQITQALMEYSRSFDLSEHYSASQVYKSANQKKTVYDWYMLNDGIEMLVPALAGNGQYGIFIPYTRLEGIIKPEYLPAENIGSATVKAVRRENLLDDYDGQLIYNDNGESTTGVQLDGLATHIWIDERTSSPVSSCGKYFYGYKVKDVTVMMPTYEGSVGAVWTDYLGDHFDTITVLPAPEPEPTPPIDQAP